MDSTLAHLQLPTDLLLQADAIAQATGQRRDDVVADALAAYLTQVADEDARLAVATAAADRGEVVDAEVVDAETDAYLLSLGMAPERLAAIQARAEREADEIYGPCE